MLKYTIPHPFLRSFKKEGVPFMTFDAFNNVAQEFRDNYWASQHVEGFLWDMGVRYNVWTVQTINQYHRHLMFHEQSEPLTISFAIPDELKASCIPLDIILYDSNGAYFTQRQFLAIERITPSGSSICAWKRIDTIRDFVLQQVGK